MGFVSLLLFNIGSSIESMLPSKQTGLCIVSEKDFHTISKKHDIECSYCDSKNKNIRAIGQKNGKYIASCPSDDCYRELIYQLGE